ncbi:MAG: adenylyl-sulfate kinase [Bacteroidota bacterium]|jgi:adenylyl-sulfate kinase
MMDEGHTFWFTGLSGAGKTTLSKALTEELSRAGKKVVVLDGDELRSTISSDLGFTEEDRMEQNRRAANIAWILNEQGIHVLAALISPTHEIQTMIKHVIGINRCFLIHVDCSIEGCKQRDVKQLYSNKHKQNEGNFTGIHQPYEKPINPWLKINTEHKPFETCKMELLEAIHATFNQ